MEVVGIVRIGDVIGDPVVDLRQPGRIGIAQVADLDRGGARDARQQPAVLGEAREVDQDVDPIVADRPRESGIVERGHVAPLANEAPQMLGHAIGLGDVRVGDDVEPLAVECLEDRRHEIGHRMGAKVRRQIADPQATFRIKVALEVRRRGSDRIGERRPERSMLAKQIGAREVRVVVEIHEARHLERRRARGELPDRPHRSDRLADPRLLGQHRTGEIGDVGGLSAGLSNPLEHFGHARVVAPPQKRRGEQDARFSLIGMLRQHALGGFDRLLQRGRAPGRAWRSAATSRAGAAPVSPPPGKAQARVRDRAGRVLQRGRRARRASRARGRPASPCRRALVRGPAQPA